MCKWQPIPCILTGHAYVHQKLLCCSEHVLTKILAYSLEKMAKNCLLRNRGTTHGNGSHMLSFLWTVGSSRGHWAVWMVAMAPCSCHCPRRRSSCVCYAVCACCIQSDTDVLQGSLGKMVMATTRTIHHLGKKADKNSCVLGFVGLSILTQNKILPL